MYITPQLNRLQNSRSELRQFGGLNETYACSEAEYQAGLNFSSRDFPALSTRTPRRKMWEVEKLHGVYHLNGLLTVYGTTLEYTPDEEGEHAKIVGQLSDTEKQLAGMGTSVLIWPDKKIFDTATGMLKAIEAEWTGIDVSFELCDAKGTTYAIPSNGVGTELPDTGLTDGRLFLLAKNEESLYAGSSTLQQYSVSLGTWNEIILDYCKITCSAIGTKFAQWDTVTLSGVAQVIRDNIGTDLEDDKIIYVQQADSIVVPISGWEKATYHWAKYVQTSSGVQRTTADGKTEIVESGTQSQVKLERTAPDMDYLCENDNRVWGCASGENVIYACKLGDPTNWYSYRGIASDSYAVTVGSDGAFTGAASCMGYALFFKENAMHKVYGSKPSDYQVTNLRCRGVAKNAYKSLCVINETLYYLSTEGVMSWDGSLPGKVSATLARDTTAKVTRAVGGQLDGRYYLYTETAEEDPRLLVYDTERGMWHEETPAGQEMASTGRQLFLYDGSAMWAVDPSRETDGSEEGMETALEFDWISGDMGLDVPDDKYISRVTVRLDASEESQISVLFSFDGGNWEKVGSKHTGKRWQRIDLPIPPQRYDTIRLRLQGKGSITLRSIAFTMAKSVGNITQKTR